jgi:hypothetical protein
MRTRCRCGFGDETAMVHEYRGIVQGWQGEIMGTSAKKWRKKKMAKHKHRKRLQKTRWQRRTK